MRAAGGEALELPAVAIAPRPPRIVQRELEAAWPGAAAPRLVLFISPNAVEHGAWLLQDGHVRSGQVAAIGSATAAALSARHIEVDITPASGFTSEALLAHPALSAPALRSPDSPGDAAEQTPTVIIVSGVGGRDLLARTLSTRGARVITVPVYRRVVPTPPSEAQRCALRRAAVHLVTATSVEILHNLLEMLGDDAQALKRDSRVIAPGERVATAVVNAGFDHAPLASSGAGNDAMLDAMVRWRLGTRRSGGDAPTQGQPDVEQHARRQPTSDPEHGPRQH